MATNDTPWMDRAVALLGTSEVAGEVDNPTIVQFFAEVGQGWIKDDETAWCAAFAGAILKRSGYPIPAGVESVRARAYNEAVGTKVTTPKYGDLVLLNYDQKGVIDHVSFYVEDLGNGLIKCLGGNQSNKVKYSNFKKTDVAGYYRPTRLQTTTVPRPQTQTTPPVEPPQLPPEAKVETRSLFVRLFVWIFSLFSRKKTVEPPSNYSDTR